MKHIFLLFVSLLLLVSCAENKSEPVNMSNNVLSSKEISTNLDISYICNARYTENKLYIHGRKNREQNNDEYIFRTSLNFDNTTDITPKLENNEKISCFDVNSNGDIAVLTEKSDEYLLYVNDSSISIEYDDTYIQNLLFFDNGNIIITAHNYEDDTYKILLYDGSEIKETENMDFEWLESIENSGNSVAITYYSDNSEYIGFFNTDTMSIENSEKLEISSSISRIMSYNDRLYIYTDSGIFEKSGNTFLNICSFSDLGIDGSYIEKIICTGEGDFIAFGNDSADGMLKAFRISENDLSDLQEVKYITLGVAYTDSFISSKISEYNKNSADCKVKIVDYSQYNDERFDVAEMGASSQLNLDIVSGNEPDMLITTSFTNAENLKKKECFVNLYYYIEKSDFLSNILKISETDGKLYSLPLSFYIDTLVGKSEYVGEKENWTIDELISVYANIPQEMELMQNPDKRNIVENLLYGNLGSFVDYENKSCSFDSPQMIKFLEFVNNFEYTDSVSGSMNKDMNERFFGMINNKFLLKKASLHSFEDFHELQAGIFNNEPITFVGYPSEDDSGAIFNSDISFSVFQSSENKSECWDFIQTFFVENEQLLLDDFPVNKNAFYKKADSAMILEDNTMYLGNTKKDIGTMSDTEKKRYTDYIRNIDKSLVYDLQIYLICREEISLFLSGDLTSQKTAEMIQNRVDIYINE